MKPLSINHQDGTPIPRQLKDQMAAKIRSGEWPPDFRLPSERDLAELCGVSRMTARQAYNELLAEGLIHRRVGQGSFVAALPGPPPPAAAPTLALVYSCLPENLSQLSHFHQAAAEAGYNTLFFDVGKDRQNPETEAEVLAKCRQAGVRGIALFPTPLRDQTALYGTLLRDGIRLVLLVPHPYSLDEESWVWTDYGQAGEMGVRQLLAGGYRRVVYLAPHAATNCAHEQFFAGYRTTLAECGIAFTPKLELDVTPIFEESATLPKAKLRQFLGSRLAPGTAFLGPSMRRAACVYQALLRLGVAIPGDYAVAGFGDPLPTLPGLTRIDPRTAAVMRAAVELLTSPAAANRVVQRLIAPLWVPGRSG